MDILIDDGLWVAFKLYLSIDDQHLLVCFLVWFPCCELLSNCTLASTINIAAQNIEHYTELWVAFKLYLSIDDQHRPVLHALRLISCELLSNCTLASTINIQARAIGYHDELWVAFKLYLSIDDQHRNGKRVLWSFGCELLSNCTLASTINIRNGGTVCDPWVVSCFQIVP